MLKRINIEKDNLIQNDSTSKFIFTIKYEFVVEPIRICIKVYFERKVFINLKHCSGQVKS